MDLKLKLSYAMDPSRLVLQSVSIECFKSIRNRVDIDLSSKSKLVAFVGANGAGGPGLPCIRLTTWPGRLIRSSGRLPCHASSSICGHTD
jgi:hypothetical protein